MDALDDTRAHIIGLGAETFARNMENPALMLEREERGDYKESFAYCLPFLDDYGFLSDSGYEKSLQRIRSFLSDLDSVDPDDVPPRLYRRFDEVRHVCSLLLQEEWRQAVAAYHRAYGEGYADDWPFAGWCGYLIPNIVRNLERYRLGSEGIES